MKEEKKSNSVDGAGAKAVRASEFAWSVIDDVHHSQRFRSKREALDEIIKVYLLHEKKENSEFKK